MGKVAVVTGSNKGIGLAIVRGLLKQNFPGDVYLTARDVQRGKDAVEKLKQEGLSPKFHQLDVCDKASIVALKEMLVKDYGGLDVLVNNAGMSYTARATNPFLEQVTVTTRTNYTGLVDMCDILFPILNKHARVVHVSSLMSFIVIKKLSEARKQQFINAKSVAEVTGLLKEFEKAAEEKTLEKEGWAEMAYPTTKLAVTSIAPIQQADMDKQRPDDDIVINSACPGFVATDMTKAMKGGRSPDKGAETMVYLALLPDGEKNIRGKFLQDKKVYDWQNGEYAGIVV